MPSTSLSEAEPGDDASAGARPRTTPATNTAARLLEVAAAQFRAHGYASSTTRELAQILSLKKASLYHYISSKEDLLYAVCMNSMATIHEQVNSAAMAAPPERRLRAIIEEHVAGALLNRDQHVVMLIELRNLSAPRLAEVIERRDSYEAMVREVIVSDQQRGWLRSDMDAKYLTLALLNLLSWTIFWYDPEGDLKPEELGRFFADVFLNGARAHPE